MQTEITISFSNTSNIALSILKRFDTGTLIFSISIMEYCLFGQLFPSTSFPASTANYKVAFIISVTSFLTSSSEALPFTSGSLIKASTSKSTS